MKISNSALMVALVGLLETVNASYQNAAPLLVSSSQFNNKAVNFLERAEDANIDVKKLTNSICSNDDNDILYVTIHGLQTSDLSQEFFDVFDNEMQIMSDNVIYDKKDGLEFEIDDSCSTTTIYGRLSNEDQLSEIQQNIGVNMIELYNGNQLELLKSLKKLAAVRSFSNIIVQGVPFSHSLTLLDSLKKTFLSSKRHDESVADEELNYDAIQEELRSAFQEIEGYMEANLVEDDDSPEDEMVILASNPKSATNIDGGLFDKYTFFTPGIWMASLVSLFLIYLVSVSLSWLGSMQISYKAFDKPIDFEKKLQ